MMNRSALAALAGLALGACTTAPPPLPETKIVVATESLAPPPSTPATQANFDPKALAADTVSASECASNAKEIQRGNAERGWAMLKACIERGSFQRGDFTDMRLLLNGAWDADLATRPEAPVLLTKVIAMRGGDVEGDLKLLQGKRIPLFTLAAALKQPDTYKGRFVVVRAEMEEGLVAGEKLTARLNEHSLFAQKRESEVEGERSGYASSSSGSASGSYTTTKYGSGSGQVSGSSSYASKQTKTNVKYENKLTPTGRSALGKLGAPDPFLEPGKSYLFLARFDGVRKSAAESEGETPKSVAVLSIVKYFPPSAMLVD